MKASQNINTVKKYLLIVIGLLSLGLGIAGVFLPILPTTPFLLLTSICFYKSSLRLHQWLHRHRIFGPYITSYLQHKAIKKSIKISSLVILWTSLVLSSVLVSKMIVTAILFVIGLAVSYHILSLRTLKHTDPANPENPNDGKPIL